MKTTSPTKVFALTLALAASTVCVAAPASAPLYLDPSRSQAERIDDLIARMTLEEKQSMMVNSTPGVPRLGIPKYDWWSEALHGVANAGHATVFPQAIGLAAMWNESFHGEIAQVIGVEGRAKFNGYTGTSLEGAIFRGLTFWSPNVNIFRDPRWGRGQETYGEDPFLTARLGVAFVHGLQGDHPDYLVAAACAKHFAVHSGPESLRHEFDATVAAADLHETYLPAFEALVREGRVEVVMTAYNALNGVPCSVHPLLYDLLGRWGFAGHVTSDCGSVEDLSRSYKWAVDDAAAQALTLRAGMNVRCGWAPPALDEAVRRGLLTEAEIDRRLHDLLRTLFRLGFFDPKERVPFTRISPDQNDTPAHGALALRAARESLVLLKNDGLLPLDPRRLKRVAVIGPNATSVPALNGNYNGEPSAPVTVLAGLKAALEPAGVRVDYAHGCDYSTRPAEWRLIPHPWFRGEFFANGDLAGEPVAKRTERPLCYACNASRAAGALPAGLPDTGLSARWSGELQTTMAGEYRFRVRARGGFRLRIDGGTVIDSWSPAAAEAAEERAVTSSCVLPDNASIPLELEYAQGTGPVQVALEWITPPVDDQAAALAVAREADVIVFVGGISAQLEGEEMDVDFDGYSGGDRQRIELPELQQRLLEQLHATGKPIVFVNLSGSAVAMPWASEKLPALLQAWYPGQAGGTAVADVLIGNYNPAGRLPVTFYRSTEDLPEFTDYALAGRTYRYFGGKALFPFGHGLSYTKFSYGALRAVPQADGSLSVEVAVTNTGDRAGDEVVQLYAVPPAGARPGEIQSLCGFRRVPLQKGETRKLSLSVPASALRRWDNNAGAYAIPHGAWTIRVGASSADIRGELAVGL
ncbi:MAG TPA: glycoside hydrolase family 3 C-terminal domain-containing protein [Opitutaceae bacterium]|nr:glycoside hydrolase family 3 C-terminal domain-containing protein [Opitutaceae bacterium]